MKRTVEGEQYFTPVDTARKCVEFVAERFPLENFDLVVEPSAGEGAFFEQLPVSSRIGIDIEPRHPGLVQADFLAWRTATNQGRTLTIGNPPFGQRAAIAFEFINAACSFSDVVAFILPRSFNKYTFINRVPRYFHLVDSFECSEFYAPDGTTVEVRTVFQIWEKRPEIRNIIHLADSHPDFEMKHAHISRTSEADLSRLRSEFEFTIPQVGASFFPRDVEVVDKGSHWFIKPKDVLVRKRFEVLDFSFLDGMNTAHKSLSKRDIIAAYQNVVGVETTLSAYPDDLPTDERKNR